MSLSYQDLRRLQSVCDGDVQRSIFALAASGYVRERSEPVKLVFLDSRTRQARPRYLGPNPFASE